MSVLKNKRNQYQNVFQINQLTLFLLNYTIKYISSTKVIPKKYRCLFIRPLIQDIMSSRKLIKDANQIILNSDNYQIRLKLQKQAKEKILKSLNTVGQIKQLFNSNDHKIDVFSKTAFHIDNAIKKWIKSDKQRINKTLIQEDKKIVNN